MDIFKEWASTLPKGELTVDPLQRDNWMAMYMMLCGPYLLQIRDAKLRDPENWDGDPKYLAALNDLVVVEDQICQGMKEHGLEPINENELCLLTNLIYS